MKHMPTVTGANIYNKYINQGAKTPNRKFWFLNNRFNEL